MLRDCAPSFSYHAKEPILRVPPDKTSTSPSPSTSIANSAYAPFAFEDCAPSFSYLPGAFEC